MVDPARLGALLSVGGQESAAATGRVEVAEREGAS